MKLILIFAAAAVMAAAQTPDNTKINKRDQSPKAITADQQSNSSADLELVRKIRHELTADKTMSTYARNIKVITRDGMAHLRGPVRSAEEKASVEAIAKRVAGDTKVMSHLEIAPAK